MVMYWGGEWGERASPVAKDGQGQATLGAGHGRRAVQHSENNASSVKGSFYPRKRARGFIYLCCCFVGKKNPNPTNNNHQGVRDVKLRNLSLLTRFSRYTLILLCSQHVAANMPQITWTNQEFCFRLYWFVMFLLLYGIWGLFPVDEGEISLIYLATHEVHSQYSGL